MSGAARLAELIGTRVARVTDLGTSHSWRLHRAALADGREVFVKSAADQAGVFAAEAAGLRWLGEARGAPVPEVLAADEHLLVLPWLPSEPPTDAAAERFGRELAGLHASGTASFGAPWPGFIAELPLDNTPPTDPPTDRPTDPPADPPPSAGGARWPAWFAERRLVPFLRRAAPDLGSTGVALVERVIANIDALAGPPEPVSRIHGDLWSGNVLWSGGRGWLIDPAAHGGHRETDLAMLALFGAPGLDRVLAAYQEVTPLAAGWRDRIPLHQLHPLLVHVALFGSSYRSATVDAARTALAALAR